jgi:hypothetical protein
MPAHTSSCRNLGIKILINIIHNRFSSLRPMGSNLKFKDNSLWLRVSNFKYKALRLRFKYSQDNKLLV